MHIAVIGAGNIGANAARHFVLTGHQVQIVGSGDAAKLAATAQRIGATPSDAADAVCGCELVMLAMPWVARAAVFAEAGPGAFAGKIVLDAMNPYTDYPATEDLHGRTSSEAVASELPGARVVKALNTLYAALLADGGRAAGAAGRIALPVAADDKEAERQVMALLDAIGFDALEIGALAASRPMEPGQPLYAQSYTLAELRGAIGTAA